MSRELSQGLFIRATSNKSGGGRFGGPNPYVGADCPNCRKPLMMHLLLDTNDPRLAVLSEGPALLPLLYCTRCALCWEQFSYQVREDSSVRILEVNRGETLWDEFYEDIPGDTFPERGLQLVEIPPRLAELNDLLNGDIILSEHQEREYNLLVGRPTNEMVLPVNQLGGRAYLPQQLLAPLCPGCIPSKSERERREWKLQADRSGGKPATAVEQMYFLASLFNDKEANIIIGQEGMQIVFFFCPRCYVVAVQHSIV